VAAADRVIRRLADERMELMTRFSLLDAGVSASAIAHRLRRGALHGTRHPGVYATTPRLTSLQLALAAVLAGGPGAVLSHASAGWLWNLLAGPLEPFDVLRAGAKRAGPATIALHRTVELPPGERTIHRGIPVTTPARTLLDLAATGGPGQLELALDEAPALRLVERAQLDALAASGRRGAARLRALLDDAPGYTRGEAERLLRRLIRDARLATARHNVEVLGAVRDAYWPEHGLVLEIDGWAAHGHRTAFETDRRRDQVLTAAGLRPMRATWRQLTEQPLALAASLGAALAVVRAA